MASLSSVGYLYGNSGGTTISTSNSGGLTASTIYYDVSSNDYELPKITLRSTPYAAPVVPESECAWLRRRVDEMCWRG